MENNTKKSGKRLIESFEEAIAFLDGDTTKGRSSQKLRINKVDLPEHLDVREIRDNLHMSQAEFATRFSLNLSTLKNWEYGRRSPDLAAKAYLLVISKHPDLIEQYLRE